ncbi:MAG TPA: class D sortase [Bacillota bacterium]|nr:class D sortase [Bacillota bacterium]
MNPLFSDQPDPRHEDQSSYVLARRSHRIEPPQHAPHEGANPAVDLIRRKIDALYAEEPNARTEIKEAATASSRSKHQEFMYKLSTSGKSLAEIQTAWHEYYASLPDDEKREVWQEFYTANKAAPTPHPKAAPHPVATLPPVHQQTPQHPVVVAAETAHPGTVIIGNTTEQPVPHKTSDRRTVASIKRQIARQVRARGLAELKAKQHLQSLAFGLGSGALVLLIFLFGFFNEVVIAPFIQPGSHASATPIILSQDGVAPTANPEVIIPKINAELPVIYGTSVTESDVENSLEEGVVHYASTSVPGQQGNAAFFGHSSNNIFNPGKYKFAFVLLHELVPGDIFYLTYNGKVYTYKVFQKQVVQPTETWVLNPVEGKAATVTLITCDPPGTSLHRLVVWGEQISPDLSGNVTAPTTAGTAAHSTDELAGNGPTLWTRFWRWVTP